MAQVVAAATAFRLAAGDHGFDARPGLPKLVPWFLCPFMLLVVLQSVHARPPAALPVVNEASRDCLVVVLIGLPR